MGSVIMGKAPSTDLVEAKRLLKESVQLILDYDHKFTWAEENLAKCQDLMARLGVLRT